MGGVAHGQPLVGGAESLFGLVEVGGGKSHLEGVHFVGCEAPEQSCAAVKVVLTGGQKILAAAESRVVEVVLELFVPAAGIEVEEVVEESCVCAEANLVAVPSAYIFDERGGEQGLGGGVAHIAGFEGGDSPANAEELLPSVVLVDGPVGADAEGEVGFGDREPLGALVRIDAEDSVKGSRQRWIHGDRSRVELGVVMILCPDGENRHAQGQQQRQNARAVIAYVYMFQ